MNPDDLQSEPCSITTVKLMEARTHECVWAGTALWSGGFTALGGKCLTLTCPPYSFHSEGSARLYKESFVLQHVQWIYSCTSTTADDWMMIEGKSSSCEALQTPLDPHAKYCSQDAMAVQMNTIRRIHSDPPTQSETKSSLWCWNHTALMGRSWKIWL